jgi:uncharacterized protein YraI
MRVVLFISLLVMASLACSLSGGESASVTPIPLVVTATQSAVQPTATPTVQPSQTPANSGSNGAPSCVVRTDWYSYTVVAGDTLSSIAQRSNTTTAILLQANCLANADVIRVGQVIRVPSTPLPPTQAPSNSLPTVTENGVNVRSGPGQGYMVIGTLNRLARVQPRYRSEDGLWILMVTDGIEGWVSSRYLAGLIPSQIPVLAGPYQPPIPNPPQGDSILNDNTNVYTGPGLGYMIFGVVHRSTPVQATHRSEDGLWVLITSNIIEGWVWSGAINTNRDALPVLPGPYQPPVGNN